MGMATLDSPGLREQDQETLAKSMWIRRVQTEGRSSSLSTAQRTVEKRRQILRLVLPDIPETHAPDIDVFRGEFEEVRRKQQLTLNSVRKHFSKRFLWPFVNLDDLCSNDGIKCS
jgi:hypothetical protein